MTGPAPDNGLVGILGFFERWIVKHFLHVFFKIGIVVSDFFARIRIELGQSGVHVIQLWRQGVIRKRHVDASEVSAVGQPVIQPLEDL